MRIFKKFLLSSLVVVLLGSTNGMVANAADTVNPNTTQQPTTGGTPVVTSNVPTIPAVPTTGTVPCTPPSPTSPTPTVDPGSSAPVCVNVPKAPSTPKYSGPLTMTTIQKGLGATLTWKYGKDQPLATQTINVLSSTGALNGQVITLPNKTRSTTISGLTAGAKYTFTLSAGTVKSKGKKLVTIVNKLTPIGIPSKVSLFEVKIDNNIADLNWVYLGEKLVNLNVGITVDGSKEVIKVLDPKLTTFRVNSVVASKSYRFRVFGTNLAGAGPSYIKGYYNSAPANPLLSVDPVNGVTAKLTWDQPGAPASFYTVHISSPGNLKDNTNIIYDGSISSATITGLTALENYSFTVKATNDLGSATSQAIGISLSFFPSQPQDFKIVPGDKSATLTWKAPLSYGQGVIKNYFIYSSTDKGIHWITATKISDDNSINVPGLKNDTTYYFKVTAANDMGEGLPTPTLSVIPTLAPFSASGLVVKADTIANGGGLFLSWVNPTTTSAVYKLSYRINGTNSWLPLATGVTGTSYRASGLSMATLYDFQLENVNAPTTVDSKLSVTGETNPNTPQNLLAKVSGSTVDLAWDKSTVGSGGVVSGYKVEYNSGASWVTAADLVAANNYTFKSYSPLLPFSFRVSAVNRDSNISLASIIASPPTAPLALAAVADNKFVTLTWTAPTSFGTSPITGYTIESAPSATNVWTVAGTVPSTLSTYVVNALTNDTAYLFRVTANTNSGNSSPSTFVTATPGIKLPSVPLNLAAIPGDKNVTLTWDTPLTIGTSPITGYIIESSLNQGLTWSPIAEVGPFTTYVVPNLTNDTGYRFRVLAKTVTGNSLPSIYVTSTSGSTPYGASGFTAIGAANSITLSWLAPSGTTSSPVYTINYKVNGTTAWKVLTTGVTALTYTATGLTAATRYDFRLTNTAVPAGVTANVDAVGAETAPNAPLNLTSRVNVNTVDLAWDKPIIGTSGTVQGYRIEVSTGGTWSTVSDSYPGLTYTFKGYNPTQAYSFRVSALNFDSLYSIPSVVASPPTIPLNAAVVAGLGSATISWSTPTSSGSSPITGYTIESSSDRGRTWTAFANLGLVNSYIATGLTNDSIYYFRISANTNTGSSAPTEYVSMTPGSTPYTPNNLVAKGGVNSVILTWVAPSTTVTPSYTVKYRLSGTTASYQTLASGLSALTYTATSLTAATSYDFMVVNTNAPLGMTVSIETQNTETAPNAPRNLVVTPLVNANSLVWDRPIFGPGSTLAGYKVEYSTDGGTTWLSANERVLTESFTFPIIDPLATYTFRVSAFNNAGLYSSLSNSSLPPSVPTSLTATPGDQSITLNWVTPVSSGSSGITGYTVGWSIDNGNTWNPIFSVGSTTTYTVVGLHNGATYLFRVIANTATGTSAPSATILAGPGASPYTPTLFTGTGLGNSIVLTWTAPTTASPLYTLKYRVFGDTAWLPLASNVSALTYTATNLTLGTKYEFYLSNTAVPANVVAELTSAGIETAPNAPLNLKATAGSGSVTLVWDRPAIANGTVTNYKVEYSSGSTWTTAVDRVATETYKVVGLTSGTLYSFRVTALNNVLVSSAPSTEISSSPQAKPSAPSKMSASIYAGQYATIYFEQPVDYAANASLAGSYKYKVEHKISSSTSWVVDNVGATFVSSATLTTPSRAQMLTANGTTLTWFTPLVTGPDFHYTYNFTGAVNVPAVAVNETDPVSGINYPSGNPAYKYTSCAGGGNIAGNLNTLTLTGNGDPYCTAYLASFSLTTFTLTSVNSIVGNGAVADFSVAPTWDTYNACSAASITLPCQINGLTGGNTYTFRVTTLSDTTEGDNATADLLMVGNPSAPLNPKATFNASNVVVTWGTPANDGGSPITAYVLQYSYDGLTWKVLPSNLGSANCPVITNSIVKSGSTCYVYNPTGMITIANGALAYQLQLTDHQYQFRLKAYNQLSLVNITDVATPISDATLVPTTQPFSPQSLSAVNSNSTTVKLSWVASTYGSTSSNNTYSVSYVDSAVPLTVITVARKLNTALTETISGLTPGNTYVFTVNTVNSTGGSSSPATTSSTMVLANPSPVTNLVAAPGNTLADLDWMLPTTSSTITSVTVSYSTSDSGVFTTAATLTGASMDLPYLLTGLVNGTTYTIKVVTNNASGSSSDVVAHVTPTASGAAANLNVTKTIGSTPDAITLSWNSVTTTPAVNGYKVFYSTDGGTTYAKLYDASVSVAATFNQKLVSSTSLYFDSLPAGVTYTFKVEAWNFPTSGSGVATLKAYNTIVYTLPAATTPSAIGRLTLSSPIAGRIVADWNGFLPSSGGSAITAYDIYYSTDNVTYTKAGSVAADSTGSTIDGLPSGTLFYIKIVAVNAVGDGPGLSNSIRVS